jgi:hypothetical protein
VTFHEAFVTGTTFAEIYKENEKMTQRYFSPEGSGRSYSELHHAYRDAILQKYFNVTMLTASLVFSLLLLRRWTKGQPHQNFSENAPEPDPEITKTLKDLEKLRSDIEKLKSEREAIENE